MSTTSEILPHLNEVDRFILLLLGARNFESVPSMTHFQKEMYLLQNLFPNLADGVDYKPHSLGPYSETVAGQLEQLDLSGLVSKEQGSLGLSRQGREIFDILKKKASDEEIQKINEFKEFLNDLSADELLAFIHFSYPSQDKLEKESIKYRDLLPKRDKLAISLYLKDKVSAQKAAQISGKSLEDFLQDLKRERDENS